MSSVFQIVQFHLYLLHLNILVFNKICTFSVPVESLRESHHKKKILLFLLLDIFTVLLSTVTLHKLFFFSFTE